MSNPVDFKVMTSIMPTVPGAPEEQRPLKLILLTTPSVLRHLADVAENATYANHRIEQPGSASGIGEILIEVVPPSASKQATEYIRTLKETPNDIITLQTL